ncbi:carbamoyltransferase N-terminal domain-containing protein [Streptomyces sp. NPDC051567]|uniref:carbamoyltransferase N-terminal domain-containing protein n=1 Tax=Streptomyces sp. NPDC051567 TaxID=3365660 RepID=UPI0037B47E3F
MIVCGLKVTHDGAVALVDGDRLVFSVEMEKIANGARYSPVADLDVIPGLLGDFGYKPADVDEWVIDGWDGDVSGIAETTGRGRPLALPVGPYRESDACPDLLRPAMSGVFPLGGKTFPYTSHSHAAGHVASAYCSSPFAARGEAAAVLIWDGGLFPRLYWCDPGRGEVRNGGALFPLIGHAYATAGHHFGPFRRTRQSPTVQDLSVAGKLMAYIALGQVRAPVVAVLREAFHEIFEGDDPRAREYRASVGGFGSLFEPSIPPVHAFFATVRERLTGQDVPDEDVLASVHAFLEELLVTRLTERLGDWRGPGPWNVCFAGGCALNIKWNSALRAVPQVREVWVPPFPNDAGSAIGAAALGAIRHGGLRPLRWHARSGPELGPVGDVPDGWSARPCDARALARVLHGGGEPVVVLNGRAELGPRALGGRSILAAPTDPAMKDLLNSVKKREPYRPVAPVCLVGEAPKIFAPGTPDPYMLFDHEVRPEWRDRIPAVVHLDGTARLQTVSAEDDVFLAAVLTEYHALSGVPVLCNTSANLNGCGFFPDVASAMGWGRIGRIWSDGVLYEHAGE